LDEYDSEARWFCPAIMRTTTIDPLAENYYNISPYAWCGNDPINYIDSDGRYRSRFWSDIVRFFTGGIKGSSYQNGNGNWGFNVTTGKAENPTISFHSGRNNNTNQEVGSIPYGTASEQLTKFEKANYYEPSIDMKEASNDAIDFLAKILKNNSATPNQNENSQNNKPKVISTVLTGFGVVEDVYDDGSVTLERVNIRMEDGTIHGFNAKKNEFHKKDTFYTRRRLNYSNGKYETIHKHFK